jgi:MFS family permease
MMATLGLVVGLAPIVGPSVGGFLLAHLAWPALFWLNVPIGAVAMLLGLRLVPRGDRSRPPPMDWPGLALVSAGMPLWFQLARPGLGLDRPAARPARPGHHSDHVRRGPAHRPVRRRHGRDGRLAGGAGEHRAVPMAGPALANLTMRVGGAIGGALCVVVLSVSYGGLSGGLSAVEALRPVFAELHAVTIRKTVSLHNTWGDFPAEPATDALRRLTHLLLWWSGATHEALRRAPYPG